MLELGQQCLDTHDLGEAVRCWLKDVDSFEESVEQVLGDPAVAGANVQGAFKLEVGAVVQTCLHHFDVLLVHLIHVFLFLLACIRVGWVWAFLLGARSSVLEVLFCLLVPYGVRNHGLQPVRALLQLFEVGHRV